MTTIKPLLTVSIAAFLAGCMSTAAPVSMPRIPAPEADKVTFKVTRNNSAELENNVVQSRATRIPIGSSVVISVPAEFVQYRNERPDVESDSYRSQAFFDSAEQQIEKELLRAGFQVKDRSKFEAILRDLRDQTQCDIRNIGDCRDVDPAAQAIVKQLNDSLASGDLSIADYSARIKEVQAQFLVGSPGSGRKAGEQELTDISEVIRAASASDVQADYILQINEFNTDPKDARTENINLLQVPEVQDFMGRHPDIRNALTQRQWFQCQSMVASLNAKLIHVKSGDVVWIGNHATSEFHGANSNLELALEYRKYVSNQRELQNWVQSQNSEAVRAVREDNPTPPAFRYAIDLVGPMVVGGNSCDLSQRVAAERDMIQTNLARDVSAQLIGTIRTGDW